jgi:hypothetical protein
LKSSAGSAIAAAVASIALATGARAQVATSVSIQLVNPDRTVSLRVTVDGQEVFSGKPVVAEHGDAGLSPRKIALPQVANLPRRRSIVVEADTAGHAKARFEWDATSLNTPVIVVRYYPGRTSDSEQPFFTFSVQRDAAAAK